MLSFTITSLKDTILRRQPLLIYDELKDVLELRQNLNSSEIEIVIHISIIRQSACVAYQNIYEKLIFRKTGWKS